VLGFSVCLLGLTTLQDPKNPGRDPVPDTQKVAHSTHCAGCHGVDSTGQALVDAEGNDVSIYDDWQISMMGLSAHDPFWRATLVHETHLYPGAKAAIEGTCLRCHAPLGSFQSGFDNRPYSFALMLQDSLGLDGVSCSACHQQPSANLGKSFSGHISIDTHRLMFGPYPNPVKGPMQIYVGFEPVFADHIYSSAICAGCHTLITPTLDENGIPSGDFFVEQATYHEWLNSSYPGQGKECQTCHMPFIADSVVIATDLLALEKRHPFGLHQFFGANTAMLTLMQANKSILGLPGTGSENAWNESIDNNRANLRQAAELAINYHYVFNDTLYLSVSLRNKAGHKLPSGYPSRIAWLQVELTETFSGELIYVNGAINNDGHIEGRDFPFEPHHEISMSSNDVQIYELVMSDLGGHVTTRLNAAYQPLKDNRLLPAGFRRNHQAYDTVAVVGNASTDEDYNALSSGGADQIEYRIALNGKKGMADVRIRLHYHTFPSRWMEDLFNSDSLEEVARFKGMYTGFETFTELIDEQVLEQVDLSTSAVENNPLSRQIIISPNPSNGTSLFVNFPGDFTGPIKFRVFSPGGLEVARGFLQQEINFPKPLDQGLFFIAFYSEQCLVTVKPFIVL
jgi:hypothetical protein